MRPSLQNTASIRLRSIRANRGSALLPYPTTRPLYSREIGAGTFATASFASPLAVAFSSIRISRKCSPLALIAVSVAPGGTKNTLPGCTGSSTRPRLRPRRRRASPRARTADTEDRGGGDRSARPARDSSPTRARARSRTGACWRRRRADDRLASYWTSDSGAIPRLCH